MSKVIELNKSKDESFVAVLKDNKEVNIWCDEEVRVNISDKDFSYIINFSIDKLSVLKGYLVGDIFIESINEPVIVRFCVDDEDNLNIDGISIIN